VSGEWVVFCNFVACFGSREGEQREARDTKRTKSTKKTKDYVKRWEDRCVTFAASAVSTVSIIALTA
jgi:hypothetical protein